MNDCVLRTLILSKSDAIESVWQTFENYVTVYCYVLQGAQLK